MTGIIPLAFEDRLVRAFERDGEPWFVGKDVCAALDIRNHIDALSRLDEDEKGVGIADPLSRSERGGGAQEVTIISEAGVYRLVFTSRKPEAERFKRWLAHEVLPQLRRTGRYAPDPAAVAPAPDEAALALLNWRLAAVREARLLFGPARAARLWGELGLPAAPADPVSEDAGGALDLLLAASTSLPDGPPLREAIEAAMNDDIIARASCVACGVRIAEGAEEGIVVANDGPFLARLYAGTPWARGGWRAALRRLPGARPAGPMRYGQPTWRGTFVPLATLDAAARSRAA